MLESLRKSQCQFIDFGVATGFSGEYPRFETYLPSFSQELQVNSIPEACLRLVRLYQTVFW